LIHGATNHGDPFFFVSRVADYRRMLGRSPGGVLDTLLGYPLVVLRAEPELMTSMLLLTLPAARRVLPGGLLRGLVIVGGLMLFLVLGDLGDGAPTHHPERPLLTIWLLLCLVLGQVMLPALRQHKVASAGILACAVGLSPIRSWFTHRDSFVDRRAELSIGALAQQRLPADERLLVDVGDYGYFAVIAGFGEPWRAVGLAEGDPRTRARHFDGPEQRWRHYLDEHSASWVVTTAQAAQTLPGSVQTLATDSGLVLVRIADDPH
jgi:hypothetical protein